MEHTARLFKLAVEALAVTAVWVPGEGWRLEVHWRRQGDPWADSSRVAYDRLSTAELVDVLDLELPRALTGEV